MMHNWSRSTPFESENSQKEIWVYKNSKKEERKYHIDVRLGKPVDILSLQKNIAENFDSNIASIKESRLSLFQKDNLEQVAFCPVCKAETKLMKEVFSVYGATYVTCKSCHHYYIKARPTKKTLDEFYLKDSDYQSTYTNKETAETRVRQVAIPKAEWTIHQFERIYGRKPKSILDVGAGSGHFVHACRTLGIETNGVEISENGRNFCKNTFGFELINKDFLLEWQTLTGYEVITFWGLIEHVPEPMKMLNSASMAFRGNTGLVVASVPRWNCFSTAVQNAFPNSIVRHLDPLGHINCFTDSSLATAFKENDLDITAAWYFGMDAYELVVQISHLLNENKIIQEIGKYIPLFQNRLDLAKLSDEMVFAGIPTNRILSK